LVCLKLINLRFNCLLLFLFFILSQGFGVGVGGSGFPPVAVALSLSLSLSLSLFLLSSSPSQSLSQIYASKFFPSHSPQYESSHSQDSQGGGAPGPLISTLCN